MNPTHTPPAPWPTMRGNPQNTGCWSFGAPSAHAQLISHVPQGNTGILNATPVVDATDTIHVGSSDGYLYSLGPSGTWNRLPVAASDAASCATTGAGTQGAVVDSAACYLPTGWLYVPAGDRAIYATSDGKTLERS